MLVVELLGLGIRQNERIEGITINGQVIKSGQFADDLWTSLKASERNLQNTLNEKQDFGRMSGLYTNPEKCAILKIGPHRNSKAKYYLMRRLFWSPKSIKILGIYIFPEEEVMYHDNFLDTLPKAEAILNSWKYRSLTVLRKIRVVNDLVN